MLKAAVELSKSRQVWLRQRLSRISGFLPKSFNKFLVQRPWLISSSADIDFFVAENSSLVPFALSRSSIGQLTLTTYRIIDRSGNTPPLTVWIYENGKTTTTGVIPLAEDARVFQFGDLLYIYYQVAVQKEDNSLDCDIFLFDPIQSISLPILSPFPFNGKNWIPYEYEGCLNFVYSLEPLIVLRTTEWTDEGLDLELVHSPENRSPNNLVWGDNLGFFGSIRGGSQLIELGDHEYLAFTHVTPAGVLKFSHQAGALLFNAKNFTYTHVFLTSLKPGLLVDPFGIQIEDDVIAMSYSYSINNPHEFSSIVGSSIAKFKLSEVLSRF
jgi:hypothetical protein